MSITAFKGFDRGLTCRGFQYEEGVTYEHDGPVSLCNSGFHAVLLPLDALRYYMPGTSEYRQVEVDDVSDEREGDSKIVARKITVGASLGVPGFIRAHVEAVTTSAGDPSKGRLATTGDYAHAATTGNSAHAATTGYYAHAATTGDSAHAATTGNSAHVRAEVKGKGSIAAVLGRGAAAGAVGCWLVLTERDDELNVLGVKAVRVDGKRVKAGVFYRLEGGKVAAVES